MFSASCFATLILVGSSPSFQAANKDLFENWGTVLHIPSITIGVPTDMELQESTMLLDQIYEQLIVSSSEALSPKQRELDVPFALRLVVARLAVDQPHPRPPRQAPSRPPRVGGAAAVHASLQEACALRVAGMHVRRPVAFFDCVGARVVGAGGG